MKPQALIEIGTLTVLWRGMPIARMHADGRTESVGNSAPGPDAVFSPGPTFHADGTIELTKGGIKARLESDGDIVVVPPPGVAPSEQLAARLAGDEIRTTSGKGGIRLDGANLVLFHEGTVTNVIGVVEPPSMGRTALLMTEAFYLDLGITAQ